MRLIIFLFLLLLSGCTAFVKTDAKSSAATNETEDHDSDILEGVDEEYQRLTIPYLRKQTYPGSDIQIEEVKDESGSYSSYYASYQSEELTIFGQLTRPNIDVPEGGFPAVVFVHGYIPPVSYDTFAKYVDYVDYLARNGIVVFKIDLRGHGVSEGEPNGAYYSSDYVVDVLNAYSSLARLNYVDKDNIGLWGHSMAGNVVMRAMAVRPDIPKGVIWAGAVYTYTDMREYRIQDSSYQPDQNPNRGRRQEMYAEVGDPGSGNEFWGLVAPVNFITDFEGAVQIHHDVNDPVVSIEYSRNVETYFDEADADFELFKYDSGGHNLSDPAFSVAMRRTTDFYLE